MKLVVGLGNPGSSYEATRHNVGFWVIDAASARYHIALSEKAAASVIGRGRWETPSHVEDILLAQPGTFMNRSGRAVSALLTKFQIGLPDLILVYDDLDMECGTVRIRAKGSAGGHRGVASVIEAVGSDRFLRMKIGIGRKNCQDAADYVLSPFSKSERALVQQGIERGLEALDLLLVGNVTEAMNRYNSKCD